MDDELIDGLQNLVETTTAEAAIAEWWDLAGVSERPIFNYRFDHVREVVSLAQVLARDVGADADVVTVAAWLHDLAKPGLGGVKNHAKVSADMAEEYLRERGLDKEFIDRVSEAVSRHAGLTLDAPLETKEAQVVWEADKLVKLGIVGFVHFLLNTVRLTPDQSIRQMSHNLREFLPLAKQIADSMHTDLARELAQSRLDHLHAIAEMFSEELGVNE
ncbi:MAG: hypothetical protein DRP09_09060 [Candidatus Thorarchaeota archaeon]|nr:MAG: hypothetical protein DRP09_09060 [Candidatus Thorarchaeota archaeon]